MNTWASQTSYIANVDNERMRVKSYAIKLIVHTPNYLLYQIKGMHVFIMQDSNKTSVRFNWL